MEVATLGAESMNAFKLEGTPCSGGSCPHPTLRNWTSELQRSPRPRAIQAFAGRGQGGELRVWGLGSLPVLDLVHRAGTPESTPC